MKTTMTALLLAIAGCSHSQPAPHAPTPTGLATTGAPAPTDEQLTVDPTLPSWVPRACIRYHRVVVEALACGEIAQGTRDLIRKTYDQRDASWHALQDAPQGKIAEIGKQCADDTQLVHAEQTGKCGVTAER